MTSFRSPAILLLVFGLLAPHSGLKAAETTRPDFLLIIADANSVFSVPLCFKF